MQLAETDYGSQLWVILHGYPKGMIDAILFKQLLLQVRTHIGGVDGHCHRSELYGKFIVDVTVLNIVSQFLTDGLLFFVSRHCYCSPCIFLCHI